MVREQGASVGEELPVHRRGPYKYYMLSLLTLISAANFLDRQFLSLAMNDIKQDLLLSDAQLGILTGIAFAFFYAVLGIPIARWTDRGNRRIIIASTTLLFGVFVALTGFAMSFTYLIVMRVLVAIGEAGAMPTANSLIPEYFDHAQRPRAVSVYLLGTTLCAVVGFLGGGLLNEWFGWRTTFLILGLPAIVLGIVAFFTLREPRVDYQGTQGQYVSDSGLDLSLLQSLRILYANRSFRLLVFAFTVQQCFMFGINMWVPTFFLRSYDMGTGDLGLWLAVIYGIVGAVGVGVGGELASRFAEGRERTQYRTTGLAMALAIPFGIGVFAVSQLWLSLLMFGILYFVFAAVMAPVLATVQGLVDFRMRAMAIAVMLLMSNLIGLGMGPLLTGVLSDALASRFGDNSLRYALMALTPGYLWAAYLFVQTGDTVEADLAKTRLQEAVTGVS